MIPGDQLCMNIWNWAQYTERLNNLSRNPIKIMCPFLYIGPIIGYPVDAKGNQKTISE